jgi:hypothetical protein
VRQVNDEEERDYIGQRLWPKRGSYANGDIRCQHRARIRTIMQKDPMSLVSFATDCRMSEDRADMDERKKVDCSMECTSKLIYMRGMNVHVSV